ncbi:MAG: hypothetical protein HS124_06770 [Anaerolineales bacterium]|nr:hypothetical protein [Anaerolineales bacterium]
MEMKRRGRRTKGMEEAHPFAGMSQVNEYAAGWILGRKRLWCAWRAMAICRS